MKWRKKGLLYCPDGTKDWAKTHAISPTYLYFTNAGGLIYFSSRDSNGRSSIVSISLHIHNDELKVHEDSLNLVLKYGGEGTFDENGVTMSSVIRIDSKIYLYYTGWNLGLNGKFYLSLGLCISSDGGLNFSRVSEGPILTRSIIDCFTVGSLVVLYDKGKYKMWYASGKCWDKNLKTYKTNIKYAYSLNGIDWVADGKVCIDAKNDKEYYFGRPYVIKDGDTYKMFYSYRGSETSDTYRIGYAESLDGLNWIRKDDEVGMYQKRDGIVR
ncbi:MAG: hypothetical protein N2738_09410 [Thermodesulfovibrionales bacterium]|nr:hypothetical protein [Thermodesulfovibrionales bacterium]